MAIYEDHSLLFEGIRRLLVCDPSISVVGVAGPSAPSAADADVSLVDGRMRVALDLIRPGGARPWAILLAPERGDDWAARALAAGARGVLDPTSSPDDMLKAVHAVDEGEIWARRRLVGRVLDELVSRADAVRSTEAFLSERLGSREQEVTGLVARGLSNREIAGQLGIGEATVKAYLSSVFRKLELRDRGQLIALYHRTRRGAGAPTAEPGTPPKRPKLVASQGLMRKGSDRTA